MSSSATNTKLVSNPKNEKTTFDTLKDVCPGSCLVQMMEGKPIVNKETQKPEILSSKNMLKLSRIIIAMTMRNKYLKAISLTDDEISTIYEKTVSQSDSKFWFEQGKSRTTASKFKQIYTRMESDKDPIQHLIM